MLLSERIHTSVKEGDQDVPHIYCLTSACVSVIKLLTITNLITNLWFLVKCILIWNEPFPPLSFKLAASFCLSLFHFENHFSCACCSSYLICISILMHWHVYFFCCPLNFFGLMDMMIIIIPFDGAVMSLAIMMCYECVLIYCFTTGGSKKKELNANKKEQRGTKVFFNYGNKEKHGNKCNPVTNPAITRWVQEIRIQNVNRRVNQLGDQELRK